jgi:hypothetical protein
MARSIGYVLSAAATIVQMCDAHQITAAEAVHRYFLPYRRALSDAGRADDIRRHDENARMVERLAAELLAWREAEP